MLLFLPIIYSNHRKYLKEIEIDSLSLPLIIVSHEMDFSFFFPLSLRDVISFKETQVLFWVIEQLQSYTSLSSLPNHL